ncbi:MAG: hypothetical protein AAFQ77_03990, partial [Myxococcota bacterium]
MRGYSQIRYIGPSATGVRVYVARSFDSLATSSVEVDVVVIAGGEYTYQHARQTPFAGGVEPGLDEPSARGAPRGAASLRVCQPIQLDPPPASAPTLDQEAEPEPEPEPEPAAPEAGPAVAPPGAT